MKMNFIKKTFVFLAIIAMLFSNVPNGAIVLILKSFVGAQNIADKFWNLKSNPNVVDNFLDSDFADLLTVHTAYAAVGDARMQYGSSTNSTPRTRFYTNATNSWGAANATVAGTANVSWVVSKESPTEDVTVTAAQSSTGKLDIFCRSGSTWTKDISNVTVGTTGATRRFDVEFEKTSGVPMVLYSTNTATTNELAYYRKTGAGCGAGSWTGPTTLNPNPTRVTAIVLWVELEARQTSGSNVMAAAFSDANATFGGKLESMIWNAGWGNESPAGAAQGWSDLSIELQGTAGANAMKVFDLAFETNSGDLLVAWGTSTGANGTNGWRYATCAATLPCTWSAVQTPAGPLDDATNVAIAPDPGSDAIACIAQGNAGNDLSAWLWTGTGVGATTGTSGDASLLAAAAGDMHMDIDWVVSGSQRMAVGVYMETTTGYKYIYYDTVGAAWRINTSGSSFAITGAPSTAGQSVQVQTNPNNRAQLLVNFTDANSDLWSKRLAYNGAAGGATTALSTWSNSDAGAALETTVSSIDAKPFWFDWAQAAPSNSSPALSISQPDGSGDNATIGGSYNITYSLADPDNTVTAAFYYDTDNNSANGGYTAIIGDCATAAETQTTCSWVTTNIPAGSYYIYGITSDGVNPQVSAYSSGMITISNGSLSANIVSDDSGTPVASPSVSFASKNFSWVTQQSAGTLGIAAQRIRVNNTTGTRPWTLSLAGNVTTDTWTAGSYQYDFNDSGGSGYTDGADADSYGGQMTVDPSAATITAESKAGCDNTNVSAGSSNSFVEGTTNSITIVTAGASAKTGCYWDITGIGLNQKIPASQAAGSYIINMTLTAT